LHGRKGKGGKKGKEKDKEKNRSDIVILPIMEKMKFFEGALRKDSGRKERRKQDRRKAIKKGSGAERFLLLG